jgi:hypothetical protein
MGLEFVEVFMEIEDMFHLRDFNMLRSPMPYDLISADDLCEEIWQRLQGNEPAWTEADIRQFHDRIAPLQRETKTYLNSLPKTRSWWKSSRLDCLIAPEHRVQVWTEIVRIWGCSLTSLKSDHEHGPPQIPASCTTSASLIGIVARRWLEKNDPRRFIWRPSGKPRPPNAETWTRELVWHKLNRILIESLNVNASDVYPEVTLVNDLKMG